MSLFDGGLSRPAVLELSTRRHILSFHPSLCWRSSLCCNAKISADDDAQEHETTRKGFSIRVPTIPKLGDIESARRMLEAAFQALSFEMPKIPIDSALQGLSFDIFRLPIGKQGLVFDITGFVAAKLKKPLKDVEDAAVLDESFYPRCAWPRISKEAQVEGVSSLGTLAKLQDDDSGADHSTTAYPQSKGLHTMPQSLKSGLRVESKLGKSPSVATSLHGKASSFTAPVGPHCAWPRKQQQFVNVQRASPAHNVSTEVRYPHSAWPRKSLSGTVAIPGAQKSFMESNMGSVASKEEVLPCIIEGGPRCAWPRKTMSAKQSCHAESTTGLSEDLAAGSKSGKEADDGEIASARLDGAAELPRRMLQLVLD